MLEAGVARAPAYRVSCASHVCVPVMLGNTPIRYLVVQTLVGDSATLGSMKVGSMKVDSMKVGNKSW